VATGLRIGDALRMNERDVPGRSARRIGVARALSKRGLASRTQAAAWVAQGRVRVNGRVVRDAEYPVREGVDRIEVDGRADVAAPRIVVALNKPRGLVTTRSDEQGRATVYDCFEGAALPWLAPVGRLDKASEGLLLFSNDPEWAARIASPAEGPDKRYHVQVDRIPGPDDLAAMREGVFVEGERLAAKSALLLRHGQRHAWLEITLDEGRNRQIRRLLQALDIHVLRLVRVAIGPLELGTLAKGQWRRLDDAEIASLSPAPVPAPSRAP
jgi:23S rRNA pseudouridine2605 synthase